MSGQRYAFVLGTGRCGSTLVHEVLARHEQTGFVTNLDDLGVARSNRQQNALWRRLPPGASNKGRLRFAPSEGYRALAREVGPIIVDPVRDLRPDDATPWLSRRLRTFFATRAERLAAPVVLHKFTGWPRSGLLQEVFPESVFIEVVRDGRAVANSWLQMPWWHGHRGPGHWHFGPLPQDLQMRWEAHDRSFPVLAALAWGMLLDSYRSAAEQTPARWLVVRYEDILDDPRLRFAELLEHLGLPWTAQFEQGFARHRFSDRRSDAFRKDLRPADVAAIEDVIGEQLHRLGYR